MSEIKRDVTPLMEGQEYIGQVGDIVIHENLTFCDIARWIKSEGCTLREIAEIFIEEE